MRTLLATLLTLFALSPVLAQDAPSSAKWQARLRGLAIIPAESADIETIGGDVEISSAVVPELDFTYFFSDNLALELILGTAKHDVKALATAVGDIDLGSVWLLPPTLTFQYHFTGMQVKPYLGTGINYTIFYGEDEGRVADAVQYDNAVGFALQGGFDYPLNDKWFLNFDVKKIWLSTNATVVANTAYGAVVGADVKINPWLIGLGVGMKF